MNIKDAIKKVVEEENLTQEEAYKVALSIMNGETTDAQIASLITGMRMKGETVDEITGFVRAMREKVTKINVPIECLIDTCGTGGDGVGTFNISTISAFVAAGANCKVAKHGNRSVSSRCGSADLLKELGINIENPPEKVEKCIQEAGFGFLFAPLLHPAMKYAIGPRREMGIRTIFNILGPLTNPAGAKRQLLGVYSKELTSTIANVLLNLGSIHCMVVHGEDGLDEITTTGKTFVSELKMGEIIEYTITPEDFGIKRANLEELKGGTPEENAKITVSILKGEKGPKRDVTLLNAGAAIYIAGKANSLEEGIEKAKESIDSGEALRKLDLLKKIAL
ncbi:MAG: anthranilate phosphoribosyltransferase [candidate division WOR-3 bacterium]